MATYLSGQPTYLPSVQPFQPNLQLFAGALQMKQTQYDSNRKKISDLYGSLLNSPMSRDSNIQAKDEFFKSIDYEIKKLTNVDLSLEQNVNQAATLFNSMYDNKNLVKDMLWTKNYNNQMQRAEGFKNCLDPEKCGGQYWEGGVQALEWKRDEFRKATDDNAMMMGDVNYTPYVNVQDMAAKMFKELDWDVKVDTPDGNWLVTTKNGENIMGNLLVHFQKTLGEDPRIQEYYKTKAYLERKNWAGSNAAQYGSQEAAEQEYINQTTRMINESLSKAKDNAEHAKSTNKQIANDLKENIDNGDIQYDQQMQSVLDDLYSDADNYEHSENQIGNTLGTANNSISSRTLSLQGEAVDAALAMTLLDQDLGVAAQIMAFKNYERTLKENPIAMAYQEHMWRMEEAAYKSELDAKNKEKDLAGGGLFDGFFEGLERTTGESDDMAAYRQLVADTQTEMKEARTPTSEVLTRTFASAQSLAKQGGNGAAQAGNDIVALVEQAIKSNANVAVYSKDKSKLDFALKLKNKWDSKSAKEKLGWAKVFDMNDFTKDMSYDALHKVYGVASKFHENTKFNQTARGYLASDRQALGQLIGEANDSYANITQWRETKKMIADNTTKYMLTNGGAAGAWYKYLTNANGDARGEQSFAFTAALDNTLYKERKAKGNPATVFYTDEKGNRKELSVEKFFNKEGYVKPEYAAYRNSWSEGDGGSFWYAFKEAKGIYNGTYTPGEGSQTPKEMPGFWENTWNIVTGAIGSTNPIAGAAQKYNKGYQEGASEFRKNVESGKSPFLTAYKQAIRFGIDKMQESGQDPLKGFGAYTSSDLTGLVDYSNPLSKATLADVSYIKNAYQALGQGDAIFTFGGPTALQNVKHSPEAAAFIQQVIGMAQKSTDKEGRPTWGGTFNTIGGGNKDYQMYTIRLDDPRIAAYFGKGTESFEALYPDLIKAGTGANKNTVTIYLKDAAANNEFHKATKMTSMDRRLQYRNDVPLILGSYDDIHKLKLYKDKSSGGHYVQGLVAYGYNENGSYDWQPMRRDYAAGISPDMIQSDWGQTLSEIRNGLNSLK